VSIQPRAEEGFGPQKTEQNTYLSGSKLAVARLDARPWPFAMALAATDVENQNSFLMHVDAIGVFQVALACLTWSPVSLIKALALQKSNELPRVNIFEV